MNHRKLCLVAVPVCLLLILAGDLVELVAAFSQPKQVFKFVESGTTTLEVCMSPGCIADGAKATLDKLQALAPPGVDVTPGVCCSLCGNGPVVMRPNEKQTTKYRRIKAGDHKILDLLFPSNNDNNDDDDDDGNKEMPFEMESLIRGYELSIKAEKAFNSNDYKTAISLYEQTIDVAFRAAMNLQKEREKTQCQLLSETGIPIGLLWLVKARRNEASARLNLGDLDGAVLAAQASCNIGRNRCPESLEVLAAIYEKKGDASSELQALKNLFDLPVLEATLSRQDANRRRELGFRLSKLQREIGAR